MELYVEGKAIDLGRNLEISVEHQSPIWGDGSAVTIPITVPMTDSNMLALGFPGRLDAADDVRRMRDGVLVLPGRRRAVKVHVTDAGDTDGIALTLAWSNSAAYAELMDRKLPELTKLGRWEAIGSYGRPAWEVFTQTIRDTYDYEWVGDTSIFSIFPVCVSAQEIGDGDAKIKTYEILNLPYALQKQTQYTRKAIVGNEYADVTVPAGYGVTPMLRVWYVVEKVFEEAGFMLLNNPFVEDENLSKLTILSNVADACAGSPSVNWADVLPNISVGDFLKALWCRFGLVWEVDFDNATVRMKFLRDVIDDEPAINLSRYRSTPGHLSYLDPQYIKLSAQSVSDDAEPAADTWHGFIQNRSLSAPKLTDSEYVPSRSNLTFNFKDWRWRIYNLEIRSLISESSSNFNYDPAPAGITPFELESTDSFVDVARVKFSWSDINQNVYTQFDKYVPMLLVGAKHLHTELIGSQNEKDEPDRAPLVFLYAGNPSATKGQVLTAESTAIGSIDFPALVCDFKGGLFDCYWKRFDEILRFGNRRFEVQCRLPIYILEGIDVFRPVIFDNIKCLIESIDYNLTGDEFVDVAFKLRTIDTQGTYNIDALHAFPSLDDAPRNLVWSYLSDNADIVARSRTTWDDAIGILATQLGKDAAWVINHIHSKSYSISYTGVTWQTDPLNKIGTFPGDKTTREYTMKVNFIIVLNIDGGFQSYEININATYLVKLFCVFEAEPETQEDPNGRDPSTYEPIDSDDTDYYPDPDDRPDPWDDRDDDYWDDRD